MSPILIATLAGMVTAVAWGTSDWLVSRLSKQFDRFEINFVFQLPAVIIMLPIMLVSNLPWPTAPQFAVLGLISLLYTAAFLCLIKALSSGSVGIVVPLANTYALLTLVLSAIFIGVALTNVQIVAIVGIICGAVLLAYEKNKNNIPIRVLHKETFYALIAAVFWGVGFFLVDTVIGDIPWQMLTGMTSAYMLVMALILLLFTSKPKAKQALKRSLGIKIAWFAGVVAQLGAMALYFGSQRAGSIVVPAVIASSAPLVASVLSAVVDKEKIGLVKRLGAVIVVSGIIILNLV